MADIEALLQKSVDDLYLELGEADLEATNRRRPSSDIFEFKIGGIPPNPISHGRTVFNRVQSDLEKKVCDQWGACQKLKTEEMYKDEATLVTAIADLITPIVVGNPPIFVISVLIVKIGIRKFCKCPRT